MNVKRAEFLLGSGNYFHWEFNMRMTLARKGLLVHVEVVKEESDIIKLG
uniref:Polyprotein n=1 Tax=Peronospora matthiolae TaxID=2874970 RepID=A0AAV1V3C8_9STRA